MHILNEPNIGNLLKTLQMFFSCIIEEVWRMNTEFISHFVLDL